nr:MAG TPA: hypothetical protein [Herelleviridae sp.]
MEKLNRQEVLGKVTALGTIIIPLGFGSKLLNKEGSPDSGLPNYESICWNVSLN